MKIGKFRLHKNFWYTKQVEKKLALAAKIQKAK